MKRFFSISAKTISRLRSLFGQSEAKAEAAEVRLLRQRLDEAIQVLRDSPLGQSGTGLNRLLALGSKRHLYQRPWYVLIGAPGSGKTTALIQSGLRFAPVQPGRQPMPGLGSTRDCDCWFSDEAVLLDTAGRYTTQDCNPDSDRAAWLGLLDLLRQHRPRQPLNGVLLTVSSADLLDPSESATSQAQALRARLQELYRQLDMRLPVYLLVTQSDLIAGFDEFFATLDQTAREQVWGCTLPPDGSDPVRTIGPMLDALRQRLQGQTLARLQAEPDLGRRGAIAGFDQQFAATCRALLAWLAQVFAPSGYDHELMLRGVYFTSGRQEGRPIDRLLPSLGGAFGLERRLPQPWPDRGRSYFLKQLLRERVFAEQQLGRRRLAWQQQRELARVGLLAVLGLTSFALLGGWAVSYTRNRHHVAQVDQAVAATQPMVGRLQHKPAPDLDALLPVLEAVTTVSSTPGRALGEQPAGMGLGLFQGDKLDTAAEQANRALLRDWLLPLISKRVEQQLRALDGSDPEFAYEALKAYRMLHDPAHFDAAALKAWMLLDWERRPPTGPAPSRRLAFERQLDRLFDSGPLPPLAQDAALVEHTRALLLRFSLPQRIYSRLRREGVGKEWPGFSIERAAGPTATLVWVRRSGKPLGEAIAGLYTRDGYRQGFAREVDRLSRQLAAEASWVLGSDASLQLQADEVAAQVRRLYLMDYAQTWDALLADLALRPSSSLEQSVQMARILSGPDSPLPRLISAIVHETTLSPPQEPKDLADQAGEKLAGARAQLGRLFGSASAAAATDMVDDAPERLVDDRFTALRQLVVGDAKSAPINTVLKLLDELHVQLSATETAIRDKLPPPPDQAGARIQAESARLPEPLRSLLQQLSATGSGQTLAATRQNLSAAVGSQIGRFCRLALEGRYPFDRSSSRDVTREDFARLFAPGGLIDGFFQQQLAPHVDTTSRPWSLRKVQQQSLGSAGLAQFERAATIREAFFRAASLRLDFKLLEADPGLAPLTLDIDGQPLQFGPGQAGPQAVQWPGPGGGLTAQLQLGSAGLLTAEGPWALFRLIDLARTEPLGAPEKLRATFEAGGRRASFEITAASVQNPLRLRELAEFRCPQGL